MPIMHRNNYKYMDNFYTSLIFSCFSAFFFLFLYRLSINSRGLLQTPFLPFPEKAGERRTRSANKKSCEKYVAYQPYIISQPQPLTFYAISLAFSRLPARRTSCQKYAVIRTSTQEIFLSLPARRACSPRCFTISDALGTS